MKTTDRSRAPNEDELDVAHALVVHPAPGNFKVAWGDVKCENLLALGRQPSRHPADAAAVFGAY
jgi:hypothetical protein